MKKQMKNSIPRAKLMGWVMSISIAATLIIAACRPVTLVSPEHDESQPPEVTAPETLEQEEIAVLTHIAGDVTLEVASVLRRAPGLMMMLPRLSGTPSAFQILRNGTTLRVEEGGSVTVVCFNNSVYRVRGPGTVTVSGESCSSGNQLPENTATHVRPDNGRVVKCNPNTGVCVLEGETREKEGDYGNIPIILTPRNTNLLDMQPVITWVGVPNAIEYVFSLSSLSPLPTITLDASAVECRDHELAVPSQNCAMPWPEEWEFEVGNTYFLEIAARTGIASPLRPSEKSRLKTPQVDDVERLAAAVASLDALDLDNVTKNVLLAGLFAENELYGDAIVAYEAALAEQPAAILYVTLGDMYRAIDLNRYAFRAYNNALELLDQGPDDLMIRAAARFGQGQVEYSRLNFQNALPHFEAAVELYTQVGGTDGLVAAQTGLAETRERLP